MTKIEEIKTVQLMHGIKRMVANEVHTIMRQAYGDDYWLRSDYRKKGEFDIVTEITLEDVLEDYSLKDIQKKAPGVGKKYIQELRIFCDERGLVYREK